MKLQLKCCTGVHKEMVTAVAWTPENELYSMSDDSTIHRWDGCGDSAGKVAGLDAYVTSVSWFPSSGNKNKRTSDVFAAACSDGTVRLITRAGREEKKVSAHMGAVVCVRWSPDGSALCSCGEDGDVKIWSRSGNLRSTLMQTGHSLYALAWSPDSESVVVGAGRDLAIKGVQAGQKQLRWPAHEGLVVAVDWNMVNDLLLSGGEDCTYRIWDSFGRQMYQSGGLGYTITSAKWCPNGESFAVGAFNTLRLCDKTGWSHSRDRPQSGSLTSLAWTPDGTQLAAAGGNGSVVFGQVIERSLEWENFEAVLASPFKIKVSDVGSDVVEELDFSGGRVVEMSLGFGHLVAATHNQVFIYSVTNWNTPHILDMRGATSLIVQAETHFLALDTAQGVQQIWTYEGRHVSSPRFQNLRAEYLSGRAISLSEDAVAILDRTSPKCIRVCDVSTGRPLADGKASEIEHECEVEEVFLSQFSKGLSERRLAFIDRNQELWLCAVAPSLGKSSAPAKHKLRTQVESAAWNENSDVLTAIADGRLITWYYPSAVSIDRDLLGLASTSRDAAEFGKSPRVLSFYGGRVMVRRADGALLSAAIAPYPAMLYASVRGQRWEEAVRLCRLVQSRELWACMACMALNGMNLQLAEEALAAIQEVDKLEFVQHVLRVSSDEGRNAEMALYRRCPDEAEAILLQASPPLIYRAIKLNIRLFRWSRALELAVQHKTHVDTVLGYRQVFLKAAGKEETDKRFLQFASEVSVNWEVIAAKKEKEREDEQARAGVRRRPSSGMDREAK
ncbi:unnamed protein product [Pylaiella littoralis]